MSRLDITRIESGVSNNPGKSFPVDAATVIVAGRPVKKSGTGNEVVPIVDGEGVVASPFGIAITNTGTVDGEVSVRIAKEGELYECRATTLANVDTEAKIAALEGNRVTLAVDGTTGEVTVSESDADSAANGILIKGGDAVRGTVHFSIVDAARLTQ